MNDPIITSDPLTTQTLCQFATPTDLQVSASGNTTLTLDYQWYSNTINSNSGGTLISGETNPTYTPPTNNVDTMYYYCVVTQGTINTDCEVASSTAEVIINQGPEFDPHPIGDTVCLDAIIDSLSVYYINGAGIPEWQWYSNTVNSSSGGTLIIGETNPTYLPPTNNVGTIYYYCTLELPSAGCSEIASNPAAIVVEPDPTVNPEPTSYELICVGGTIATPLQVGYSGGTGNASYQWYINTTNANFGGTPILNETDSVFDPGVFNIAGDYYYYCIITLDGNGCDPDISQVAHVEVIDVPVPLFTSRDTICWQDSNPNLITNESSTGYITNTYWEIIDPNGQVIWTDGPTNTSVTIPNFSATGPNSIWNLINQGVGIISYDIVLVVENQCGVNTDTNIIYIKPQPQVYFITDPGPSCPTNIYVGGDVNILLNGLTQATMLGGNTDYVVINAPGSNIPGPDTIYPSIQDPNFPSIVWPDIYRNYSNIDTLPICVYAYNECGFDSMCCDIIISANSVTSNFVPQQLDGCEEVDIFSFIDNSTPDSYNMTEWCFDWDTISNSCNGSMTPLTTQIIPFTYDWIYNDPGYYDVYLNTKNTVTTEEHSYIYSYMTVHPRPNTNFTEHDVCVGVQDTFFETSTIDTLPGLNPQEEITNYQWYVNDGSGEISVPINSSTNNLIYTFPTAGLWDIRLECTSNNGCVRSRTKTITVHELPIAQFTSQPTPSCLNTTVNFDGNYTNPGGSTNSSTGTIIQWEWNFGDINADPSNPNTFISSGNNANGDATHIYTAPPSYTITLTVTDNNGCISIPYPDNILIENGIYANINPLNTACLGDSTVFDASASSSASQEWHWEFFDPSEPGGSYTTTTLIPSAIYTFSSAGQHNVILTTTQTLINNEVCYSDPDTVNITIWELPNPIFTADTACKGNLTNFINNTPIGNDGNITHFDWIFYDPIGCSLPSCSTQTTLPISGGGGGMIISQEFENDTTYYVEIIAYDDNSCSKSYLDSILVVDHPKAIITTNSNCDSTSIIFNHNSIDNSIFNLIQWDYSTNGTGIYTLPNTSLTENTAYLYDNPGTYQINLYIEDQNGCSDLTDTIITVYNNPTANIIYSNILCQDDTVTFCDNSLPGDTSIISWNWDFGLCANPGFSSNDCDDVIYSCNGNKQVILTVTDENNCSDKQEINIYINNLPHADFEWTNVCAGQEVELTNLSNGNDNIIVLNNWTLSDGFTSTNTNITHEYNINNIFIGEYVSAELIVTDFANCRNTAFEDQIEIHPLPNVKFIADPVCEDSIFTFINDSEMNTPNIFLDNLQAPNGDFWSLDASPTITSDNDPWYLPIPNPPFLPGQYLLSLTYETDFLSEYDGNYCSYTYSDYVTIKPVPKITFTQMYDPVDQCGKNVNIIFNAIHEDVSSWQYSITDSPAFVDNINTSFVHNIEFPGIYDLNIELYNTNGCNTDTSLELHIYPNPTAYFIPQPYSGCEDLAVIFIDSSDIKNDILYNNGSSYIDKWFWDFDNGDEDNYLTYKESTQATYSSINENITFYYPNLTVVTDNNCVSEFTFDSITVSPSPDAELEVIPEGRGLYTFDGSGSTVGDPPLPALSSDYNYIFNPPGNIDWQDEIIQYQYASNSDHQNGMYYTVYLTVKDPLNGCSSTDSVTDIYVNYFKGLYVPNTLAPGTSGGESAIFLPKGKSLSEYRMQIFDKFGNLLWITEELDENGKPVKGWDGNDLNGTPLPQGTYLWKIYAKFSDGSIWEGMLYEGEEKRVKEGAIYLIR